jgi:hypothetical protein
MKHHNKVFSYFIFCLLLFNFSVAQETKTDLEKEFEEFKKKETKNFDDYKEKVNQEIADFLKEEWKEYKKMNAIPAPFKPDPVVIPKEIPKPLPQPDIDKLPVVKPEVPKNTNQNPPKKEEEKQEDDEQDDAPEKPTINHQQDQGLNDDKKDNEIPKPNITPKPVDNNEENTQSEFNQSKAINFYGCKLNIAYDKSMLIRCSSASEEGVSKYWLDMSKQNYTAFVKQLEIQIRNYSLNDWGTYQLIKKISEQVYTNVNDQRCFQFFYLNQLAFDVKLAKSAGNLVLLIPIKEMVYGVSYLDIKGKRYFIMDNSGGSYYTFEKSILTSKKDISLQLTRKLNLDESISKKKFTLQNGKTICINYNLNDISFFNDYPQADLSVLFNASASSPAEESILKELKPMLVGFNELDAVNLILNFVQKKFEYKTDDEQFGKEKWFFPEDQLHYPYSDCEDRSVFFAYLVKKLLQLKVIGLNYPGHVAVAVAFNGQVNGNSISYKGNKYIIADPTYIGSSVGMCMPQFVSTSPKVVELVNE